MLLKDIAVKVENNELKVKYKTTAREVLAEVLDEDKLNSVLAVRVNNQVKSSDERLVLDSTVSPIYYDDQDGYKIYMRTARLILYLALKKVCPTLEVELCNTIDNSSYFICHNLEFDTKLENSLNCEIQKIISSNMDITKKSVSYEEALAIFKAQGDISKLEDMEIKLKSSISMCFIDDIATTMYGVVAPKTSIIHNIQVKKFRKGFVLVYPDKNNENIIDTNIQSNIVYDTFEEFNEYASSLGVKTVSDLNQKIIDGTVEELIRISENLQEEKLNKIIENITTDTKIKLILISGPSSSGKTTFAKKLGTKLKNYDIEPIEISMDNYFKERVDTPKLENGEYDFETVDALDLELFNAHIQKLLTGEEITMPEFNFITGKKEYNNSTIKLSEKSVIILEGIHALNPIVTKSIAEDTKYKIYIAPMTTLNMDDMSKVSTTDTRMLRRMVRDFETRGHSVDKTLNMWKNLTRGEKLYIYPFIKEADAIFNTSLIYEVAAMSVYAKPLLLQVKMDNVNYSEARRLYNFLTNFLPIDERDIPKNSLLREFIG